MPATAERATAKGQASPAQPFARAIGWALFLAGLLSLLVGFAAIGIAGGHIARVGVTLEGSILVAFGLTASLAGVVVAAFGELLASALSIERRLVDIATRQR